MTSARASPPTVGAVLEAEGTLRRLEPLRGDAYLDWRHAHEAELLAATAVLEQVQLVEQAIVETHHAAEAEYGRPLLCNFDEERMPPFDQLAAEFVADAAHRAGQPEAAVRDGLLHVEVQEMLPRRLMRHFECPAHATQLSEPGNPPPIPSTHPPAP